MICIYSLNYMPYICVQVLTKLLDFAHFMIKIYHLVCFIILPENSKCPQNGGYGNLRKEIHE